MPDDQSLDPCEPQSSQIASSLVLHLLVVHTTHTGEKSDSVKRQQGKKTVWPSENELETVPEIGYSHLPKD